MRFLVPFVAASSVALGSGCARCPFPKEPTAVPGVLGPEDDCGYWTVAIDEHLVIGLPVEDADATCAIEVDDGVRLNADPIFTNFDPDGPRWTFDTVGNAATAQGSVLIDCTDGTRWAARVEVVD